tara:strand:- start:1917 stop:2675 length:759 start_codon:yes stop_codon:yes gene_type:complete
MAREIKAPVPKKKKKNPRIYFDMDVQEAIVEYNGLDQKTERAKRNKIYADEIHYAFDKLAENIINTFKFTYFDYGFEDVKHEVVAFMVMNIHKYDHTKGSKAFSYFSIVAKNYLILHNNNNYKKLKSHVKIDKTLSSKYQNFVSNPIQNDYDDFMKQLITYFESNIAMMFKKKRDVDIAFSVIELLKRKDEIENFNKKSLYILIREMTNVNTNHITSVINVMRSHYKKVNNYYARYGEIKNDTSGSLNKLFF